MGFQTALLEQRKGERKRESEKERERKRERERERNIEKDREREIGGVSFLKYNTSSLAKAGPLVESPETILALLM